jgi:uncharacterized protein DUF5753
MNHAVIDAMAVLGLTAEALAAQVDVDPKTAARWANPGHIPQSRHRAKVAAVLRREVADLWPDALKRREPAWFRRWADVEREAYARATLADEGLTAEEADELVTARIARQSVLHRVRPPLLVAVIDEAVLRRTAAGDREMMRAQCVHLASCAALSTVQVHVVPESAGMYCGLGGPFILAELNDGVRLAHVDGQVRAEIIDQATDLATLDRRWARITGDALPRSQSLELIRKAAASWT